MHYTAPGGQPLMTKLSSAMTVNSTTLTMQNTGICPNASELTPLLIFGAVASGAAAQAPAGQPQASTVAAMDLRRQLAQESKT